MKVEGKYEMSHFRNSCQQAVSVPLKGQGSSRHYHQALLMMPTLFFFFSFFKHVCPPAEYSIQSWSTAATIQVTLYAKTLKVLLLQPLKREHFFILFFFYNIKRNIFEFWTWTNHFGLLETLMNVYLLFHRLEMQKDKEIIHYHFESSFLTLCCIILLNDWSGLVFSHTPKLY